jgi:hypothetical protein
MRTAFALAFGREQLARNALAWRTLGKKRQRILQRRQDFVPDPLGDAAGAGFGDRHIKQANQGWHQQQCALPPCGAWQGMKMQRPHAPRAEFCTNAIPTPLPREPRFANPRPLTILSPPR